RNQANALVEIDIAFQYRPCQVPTSSQAPETSTLPMTQRPTLHAARKLAMSLLLPVALSGCGSDSEDTGGSSATGSLYAIMYEVYDDVGSTSYLSVLDSLDLEAIDVSKVREYGSGRAF